MSQEQVAKVYFPDKDQSLSSADPGEEQFIISRIARHIQKNQESLRFAYLSVSQKSRCSEFDHIHMLSMSPVGSKLDSVSMSAEFFVGLLDFVRILHVELSINHRDIRPSNLCVFGCSV